jgi:4-amino-4-deoxy-L-arabinose transferase-like glycosyltransferase
MLLSLERFHLATSPAVWGHRLVAALTLIGWLLLAAFIASLYVGHSSSPYGTCAAPSGRTVSCKLLHR